MKPLLLSCFCVLLLAGACKKEHAASQTSGTFSLPGKWRLVLITGGIAGIHQTAAEWGHNASYTFRTDSTCTYIIDHDTTNTTYHIRPDTAAGSSWNILTVGANIPMDIDHAHDTLILGMHDVMDGTAEWYVKE